MNDQPAHVDWVSGCSMLVRKGRYRSALSAARFARQPGGFRGRVDGCHPHFAKVSPDE